MFSWYLLYHLLFAFWVVGDTVSTWLYTGKLGIETEGNIFAEYLLAIHPLSLLAVKVIGFVFIIYLVNVTLRNPPNYKPLQMATQSVLLGFIFITFISTSLNTLAWVLL